MSVPFFAAVNATVGVHERHYVMSSTIKTEQKKLKKKQTETRVDQEPRGLGPRGEPILGDVVCVLGYRNMFSQGYFPCFTHLSRICFSIYKILS